MRHVSTTEAKAKFSELLTSVEQGEEINITRHGEVIARLVPDEAKRRRRVRKAIEAIRELRKKNKPVSLEEIIAWKNEGRR